MFKLFKKLFERTKPKTRFELLAERVHNLPIKGFERVHRGAFSCLCIASMFPTIRDYNKAIMKAMDAIRDERVVFGPDFNKEIHEVFLSEFFKGSSNRFINESEEITLFIQNITELMDIMGDQREIDENFILQRNIALLQAMINNIAHIITRLEEMQELL